MTLSSRDKKARLHVLCLLSCIPRCFVSVVTVEAEKTRLYQWLLMTLSSGVRLTDSPATERAAQEVERELRQHFAAAIRAEQEAR